MLLTMFSSSESNCLEIGAQAPQISAPDQEGQLVDLGTELSQELALVFFYPKAHTPGCTQQVCSVRDGYTLFKQLGVTVLGVSSDKIASQNSFKEKYQLPYRLISDADGAVAKAFGKNKWSRQAYLFKDGKLIWKDTQASTAKQTQDILEALADLGIYKD